MKVPLLPPPPPLPSLVPPPPPQAFSFALVKASVDTDLLKRGKKIVKVAGQGNCGDPGLVFLFASHNELPGILIAC